MRRRVVREAGFTGVQVHGAHGYLISSFLSPVTNQRTDAWGGTLANRARFLLETLRAVRQAVGADFPVAFKLNSDDFRKGGFTHEECLQVVAWLNDEAVDLLEVSGGTYEQPRLHRLRRSQRGRDAGAAQHPCARSVFPRLRDRDPPGRAHAADGHGRFPHARRHEAALGDGAGSGDCDVIGLGRPLCWMPDFPRQLLTGARDRIEDLDDRLRLRARGWLSPQGASVAAKALNAFAAQSWYYCQIFAAGEGTTRGYFTRRAVDVASNTWARN